MILSMRCSRSKVRTISFSSFAASKRWANSSTVTTAKILLAGYKRATNIIRIEEKKDGHQYTGAPVAKLYDQSEEKALAQAIDAAKTEAGRAVRRKISKPPCAPMARLRPHVDTFFDKVTVNVEDKKLRENRLKLLNEIRAATRAVADFSKIEG
jgi:glycyl-tRNA synthetase beta chain